MQVLLRSRLQNNGVSVRAWSLAGSLRRTISNPVRAMSTSLLAGETRNQRWRGCVGVDAMLVMHFGGSQQLCSTHR